MRAMRTDDQVLVNVNGQPREIDRNLSVRDLLDQLSIKAAYVAVELNRQIVKKDAWDATLLRANDKIEVVHFVGGGRNQ